MSKMFFCLPNNFDALVRDIKSVETMRLTVIADTAPWGMLAADERALRARLATTPEQRALVAAWRMRVEANKRRKQPVQTLRFVPPQGPRSA